MGSQLPVAMVDPAGVTRRRAVTEAIKGVEQTAREVPPYLRAMLFVVLQIIFRLQQLFRRCCDLLRPRRAVRNGAPPHVALAGAVGDDGDAVARLALAAQRAGASRFSVCARSPVIIEKACARIGLRLQVRVFAPAPRTTLVRAARALAALPPDVRDCKVTDVPSVVRWLDGFHCANALDTEPDVLVVLPPAEPGAKAVCFASFSVWQLRLTQFRFAECPIARLDDDSFLEMVCSATNVAKRFGR